MKIIAEEVYHIYNQGNNKETIFYHTADYEEFLRLYKKLTLPHCKTLAYCLMPNHFHFLIYTTEASAALKKIGNLQSCVLANGFRLLQTSYAAYANKKYNRTGSLFRQKTKAKPLTTGNKDYYFTALQYIHQNPFRAGLVTDMGDWEYSSFPEFAGIRKEAICDLSLAEKLIGFGKENFIRESEKAIDEHKLSQIIF